MIFLRVPGSKSITNRALLLSALAKGKTVLKGALESDDTKHAKRALGFLGVKMHVLDSGISIKGGSLSQSRHPLFCGNSGTAIRFLAAILAAFPFESVLTGETRMGERPIDDLVQGLKALGAKITYVKKTGFPPIKVQGPLQGGHAKIRGDVSSQFLSALLMTSPLAKNDVTIEIIGPLTSKPYVDMTIDTMEKFGVRVKRKGYKKFSIKGSRLYRKTNLVIEGDASSASYFWGISALTGEPIAIENIPTDSFQADLRFKQILDGGFLNPTTNFNAEKPIKIDCGDFPDSAMTLAVLSAFRKGKTVLTGLSNLRIKECDRLRAMTTELRKIGAKVKQNPDGWEIIGDPNGLHPATIETYNDHRIAMCFGMADFFIPGMKIKNLRCVEKTYPNFWKDLESLKKKFLEKNAILTGMRGSGKSKLGSLLGRQLGRRFIDLDEIIERMAGKSISQIVQSKGWKFFRALETKAVRKIQGVKNAIISTGGGTLMFRDNTKILKKIGKVIYLNSTSASLKKRLLSKDDRPSLGGKKGFIDEIEEVRRKREPTYQSVADGVIDVSETTHHKKRDLEKKLKLLSSAVGRLGLL